MNKIKLEIVGLTQSKMQATSYAIVLGEVGANRRLPIMIGGFEAQAIAVAVENVPAGRPLTHDLMKNFCNEFGIELQEVVISELSEGIFYSRLICVKDGDIVEIDSRTSDAIALAVRFNCPIFTYESIMDTAGIVLEGASPAEQASGEEVPSQGGRGIAKGDSYATASKEDLENLLQEAIEKEDYEKAAKIRDEIANR